MEETVRYEYAFNISTKRALDSKELRNSYAILRCEPGGIEIIEHPDGLAYKRGDLVMVVSYIPRLNQDFGACMTSEVYEALIKEAKKVKIPIGVFAWAYRWGYTFCRNNFDSERIAEEFFWYCDKKPKKSFQNGLSAETAVLYVLSALSVTEVGSRPLCKDVIRGVCNSWDALMSVVAKTPEYARYEDGVKQEYRNLEVKATVLNTTNDIIIRIR